MREMLTEPNLKTKEERNTGQVRLNCDPFPLHSIIRAIPFEYFPSAPSNLLHEKASCVRHIPYVPGVQGSECIPSSRARSSPLALTTFKVR